MAAAMAGVRLSCTRLTVAHRAARAAVEVYVRETGEASTSLTSVRVNRFTVTLVTPNDFHHDGMPFDDPHRSVDDD